MLAVALLPLFSVHIVSQHTHGCSHVLLSVRLHKATSFKLQSDVAHPLSIHPDSQDKNRMLTAMAMQLRATYGLFRSPIRAHFQKIPRSPSLFLSSIRGVKALMYAQVQMSNKTTVSRLWKLNSADIAASQLQKPEETSVRHLSDI